MTGKIVVDLDGCLAGPKPEDGSYADCSANGPLIARLRELRALGWQIAIHTSRNVRTHEHNAGKISATTLPEIIDWLVEHDVPYDEIWTGKPWSGTTGVYVDDRAVRPSELLRLNSSELLARARGEAFTFGKKLWVQGTKQDWHYFDLRSDRSAMVTGEAMNWVKQRRDEGFRSFFAFDPRYTPPPGLAEELKRNGALWSRFDPLLPWSEVRRIMIQELSLDGLTDETSRGDSREFERSIPFPVARHFNQVTLGSDGFITKTSEHPTTALKLKFEQRWLAAFSPGFAPRSAEVPSGYRVEYLKGGSLNKLLLREKLDMPALRWLADELIDLWKQLETANPVCINAPQPKRHLDAAERQEWHDQLIVAKSLARLGSLNEELGAICGASITDPWIVNGSEVGSLTDVVKYLIDAIPVMKRDEYGPWHGDFCPGNIVMQHWPTDPDATQLGLMLIDPRGTVDNETLALYGDRRYDLAKLAHALCWGYDAIVEGWRDCSWDRRLGIAPTVDVNLRLWDDDAPFGGFSASKTLWHILDGLGLKAGGCAAESSEIHALAALQLITCASLHKDDPERVMSLIARGLQAAQYAGWNP